MGQGSRRLNDTGITCSGNALSGNNATCESAGAKIAQQHCSKGLDVNAALNGGANGAVGFSFTKISNGGGALPAAATFGAGANEWACTCNNVTGLMWEVKKVSERRSQDHTYTWFSSDASNNLGTGAANGGVCADAGQCDTEKYAQLTNGVSFCGRNDGRMPHRPELQGIVH